jgi:hypothetical protein
MIHAVRLYVQPQYYERREDSRLLVARCSCLWEASRLSSKLSERDDDLKTLQREVTAHFKATKSRRR